MDIIESQSTVRTNISAKSFVSSILKLKKRKKKIHIPSSSFLLSLYLQFLFKQLLINLFLLVALSSNLGYGISCPGNNYVIFLSLSIHMTRERPQLEGTLFNNAASTSVIYPGMIGDDDSVR